MKKIIAMILSVMLLCTACVVLAEDGAPEFATFGDAFDAAGEEPVYGGSDEYIAVIVEKDGNYYRVVSELDEKGQELDAVALESDIDDLDEAIDAFDKYVRTLPVSYVELFTVQPMSKAEIDAMTGKTFAQLEEEGYEYTESGTEGAEDNIVFRMAYGVYSYDCVVDSNAEDYHKRQEEDNFDDLNYHADGTVEVVENEIDEEDLAMLLLGDFDFLTEDMDDAAEDESDDESLVNVMPGTGKDDGEMLNQIGNLGEDEDDEGLPSYEYAGEDPIEGAIADAMAGEEFGEQYLTEPGYVTIPCVMIFKTEQTGDTVKVTGNFWTLNYVLEGQTLKCISGGEHPGVITLEMEDEEWLVTSLDEIGDEEDYAAGLERITGGDKDLIASFNLAHDMGEEPLKSVREKYLREYIAEAELDVTAYQDEGSDPVVLK